ncbi:MAG: LCP family protein [Oscillospiraceae bacterium]|nr:LCP family protein [Oscillospiraceae bacterium]
MAVKRKSNWYIYFTAFGITIAFVVVAVVAFRWYLFPEEKTQTGVDSNSGLTENYRPTEADNFNTLFMLSRGASDNPELFLLIEYNAVENRIVLIPLSSGISVKSKGMTLTDIYGTLGGQGIVDVVEDITGVECESYAMFDQNVFTDIVQSFGNVKYNVPKTVIITDEINAEIINAGDKLFSAEALFRYIMQADFGEGELYRFNIIGDILSSLINQNFRELDSARLSSFFSSIISDCETNANSQEFSSHLASFLYLVDYGSSPAEYYIPYGEYTADGGFDISDNSIITIKQKAGLL